MIKDRKYKEKMTNERERGPLSCRAGDTDCADGEQCVILCVCVCLSIYVSEMTPLINMSQGHVHTLEVGFRSFWSLACL